MVFKIIAKIRFQHVTHYNCIIPPRPQHMYDTSSFCTFAYRSYFGIYLFGFQHFLSFLVLIAYMMLGIYMEGAGHRACTILAVSLVLCQHLLLHTHTGVDLVGWLQELGLATTSYTADMPALCVLVALMNSTRAGWSPVLSWSCGTAPIDIHRKWNSRSS